MAKVRCEECDRTFKNEEALQLHNQAKHGINPAPTHSPTNSKPKKNKYIALGVIALVILVGIFYFAFSGEADGSYDNFAQCLTDSGAKMYGAYWCPHCQDQKEIFGASWEYVDYVECSLPNRGGQNAECNAEGIQSYPTWEFPDGSRSTGVFSLEQLAQITGCELQPDPESE